MVKKATLSPKTRRTKTRKETHSHEEKIAATIAELDKLEPGSVEVAKAIALFKSWLEDDSGYDEKVWPQLKKALNRERDRVGARRLFDD